MEMSVFRSTIMPNVSITAAVHATDDVIVKTKPLYAKKTFLWELESIEKVMADGVQRAIFCDFEIGKESFSYTNGASGTSPIHHSKWRLSLDLVDIEPAIVVEKRHPIDSVLYYKLSVKAMKNQKEETDVISFPNDDLFYEGENKSSQVKSVALEPRKFTLHKQLDYGCSYTSWFKDVLVGNSLLLKVEFETCGSSTA